MSAVNAAALLAAAGGDYQISRSVRLRSSASAYFNRTPASAGSRTTWTWSGWVKIGAISANDNSVFMALNNTSGAYAVNDWSGLFLRNNAVLDFLVGNGGTLNGRLTTSQVFRDFSAWYHIVVTYDSTNATNTERMRLYVNGSRVTAFSTATYPAQNTNSYLNSTNSHFIGQNWLSGATQSPFDGYITEVNFIDGQALTPSSFGETDAITGVWKPKKYAGTYGTNGFYLNFSDNSSNTATTIGKDNSGNGNNWTPNNISVTAGVTYDSMLDVPTLYADGGNGRGNYCTLNPLGYKPSATTITQANLRVTTNTSSAFGAVGSIAVDSGKWYWEATFAGGQYMVVGISSATTPITTDTLVGGTATSYGYYSGNGQKVNNNSGVSYGATYTTNDVIGMALDLDAGTLTFYKNGTTQGTAFTSLSGLFTPAFSDVDTPSGACDIAVNFGQRPFAYTPPTGFKALNTQNLPAPTILKGNKYFDATTYTGNGSTLTVTNGGAMQPDLVWMKARNTTDWHYLIDAVRGGSKILYSNTTSVEATDATAVQSFNSNGFTIGNNAPINTNANTYVGWQWKANGSAVTNTSGSITSQVNANPTAGFSVVTYSTTGASTATIGHGLGAAPKMIIVKIRNGTNTWAIWHSAFGADEWIFFTTTAKGTASGGWNSTLPTSSVFSVGNPASGNTWTTTTGYNYVAYCFSEVAGFSKFGSYTGNGSADGPFVFCGFRPRYIMIKRSDSNSDWIIKDTARSPFNTMNERIDANGSGAENSYFQMDVTANGFKVRHAGADHNVNGGTYIFMAFAESPFKNSLAR